jgi:hypothetical protein
MQRSPTLQHGVVALQPAPDEVQHWPVELQVSQHSVAPVPGLHVIPYAKQPTRAHRPSVHVRPSQQSESSVHDAPFALHVQIPARHASREQHGAPDEQLSPIVWHAQVPASLQVPLQQSLSALHRPPGPPQV